MTRAWVLQEVRQMRVEEHYERRQQRIFTMAEAGERDSVGIQYKYISLFSHGTFSILLMLQFIPHGTQ
jgi:hypothetical protein